MIITCPSCGTQYTIKATGFGRVAKTVRCSSCNNKWLQQPVVVQPRPQHPRPSSHQEPAQPLPQQPHQPLPQQPHQPLPQQPPQMQPGYPGYPPQGYMATPAFSPTTYQLPPGYPVPPPTHPTESPPQQNSINPSLGGETTETKPSSISNDTAKAVTPPSSIQSKEEGQSKNLQTTEPSEDTSNSETIVKNEVADTETKEVINETIEEGGIPGEIERPKDPELSDDQLENLFDEDEAASGLAAMTGSTRSSGVNEDADDIDDLDDPDPLPQSLTSRSDDDDDEEDDEEVTRRKPKSKKKKKRGKGVILSIIIILLLSSVGGGLFFFKDIALQYVPALSVIYELVGLNPPLGDGLEIRNVNSERGTNENGIGYLLLRGNVTNVVDGKKPVPLIKAILIGASGEVIQSIIQEPKAPEISSGEVMTFAIKIDEPSPLARKLEVTFEARPKT